MCQSILPQIRSRFTCAQTTRCENLGHQLRTWRWFLERTGKQIGSGQGKRTTKTTDEIIFVSPLFQIVRPKRQSAASFENAPVLAHGDKHPSVRAVQEELQEAREARGASQETFRGKTTPLFHLCEEVQKNAAIETSCEGMPEQLRTRGWQPITRDTF